MLGGSILTLFSISWVFDNSVECFASFQLTQLDHKDVHFHYIVSINSISFSNDESFRLCNEGFRMIGTRVEKAFYCFIIAQPSACRNFVIMLWKLG